MTKLELMLKYVSEHNDFYKKRIKEYGIKDPFDITQWPVLTREELQANRYNMFSDGYKTKYFNKLLYRKSSSGSSGMPVNVYWDYNDYYHSSIYLWRLRAKYHQITPLSKRVLFTFANNSPFNPTDNLVIHNVSQYSLNINCACIQDNQRLMEVIRRITDFSPEWLYIQPSILARLTQCYRKYNLIVPKSLRYIESFGELLSEFRRKQFETFFNVPIVDMYGSEEHNGIAYECPYGRMHILDDNVQVEILKDGIISNHGEGEAIITNLNNHAMPLIRYNQGDVIIKSRNTACLCESSEDHVEVIKGRQYQILKDGKFEISPFLLNEVVSEVQNQYDDPIWEYSYLYCIKDKHLTLRVVINPVFCNWVSEITKSLEKTFYSKLTYNTRILFSVEVHKNQVCFENKKRKHSILQIEE